ncbi:MULTISPECIES: hypothetical protein [Gammaproteobacteria]|jgi:hypothetical protein|uniref:Uncharacterized protein n=1 Tax=Shewanella electrodiphila TaxID=934143 RepID=A0ABT0KWG9_9GAMM|nr:hypothetical protein [Shewanella electrodiphila]MCL1047969.1 hypothetical protein [Shewanella electrodiphila]
MSKMQPELTYKQMFFLIEALDSRIKSYEGQLDSEETTDDDRSDIENDLISMRPTLEYMRNILTRYKDESIAKTTVG